MENFNYKQLRATKDPSSYPDEVINNVRIISINKKEPATILGSYSYRIQKFPGDIDLFEEFTACCTVKDVLDKFAVKLFQLVSEISILKLHYITEIKFGMDRRYNVDVGYLDNGIFYINNDLGSIIKKMGNLLTRDEHEEINEILDKDFLSTYDYDILFNIFRNHRLLRWTQEEILKKYKILPGNIKMTIREALQTGIFGDFIIKLDMLTPISGNFIEMTNFMILVLERKDGTYAGINSLFIRSDTEFEQYLTNIIQDNIEQLFYSKYYYNPFKMIKRMWSMARLIGDKEMIFFLQSFITGNISLLYQMKSRLEVLINIFTMTRFNPKTIISKELQQIKNTLSSIIELSDDKILFLNKMIDIFDSLSIQKKVELLKNMKIFISNIVSSETIIFMEQNGMPIPPRRYLPDHLRYVHIDEETEHPLLGGTKSAWHEFVSAHSKKATGKKISMQKIVRLWEKQKSNPITKKNKQMNEIHVREIPLTNLEQGYEDAEEQEFIRNIKIKLYNKLFNELFNPRINKPIPPNIQNAMNIQNALEEIQENAVRIPIPPPPPMPKPVNLKIPPIGSVKLPPQRPNNPSQNMQEELLNVLTRETPEERLERMRKKREEREKNQRKFE
jgi:hypothetical protein